jgi:hypothetical protein
MTTQIEEGQDSGGRKMETGKWKMENRKWPDRQPFSSFYFPISAFLNPES